MSTPPMFGRRESQEMMSYPRCTHQPYESLTTWFMVNEAGEGQEGIAGDGAAGAHGGHVGP